MFVRQIIINMAKKQIMEIDRYENNNIVYLDVQSGCCCVATECNNFLIQHADIQRNRQGFVQISFPQTSDSTNDVPSL